MSLGLFAAHPGGVGTVKPGGKEQQHPGDAFASPVVLDRTDGKLHFIL